MRNLTAQQKKELTEWFNNNYPDKTGFYKFSLIDKTDPDTYERIKNLNPTEIFYQNANNFLEELVDKQTP